MCITKETGMCNLSNMFYSRVLTEHCPKVTNIIAVLQIQKKKKKKEISNKILRGKLFMFY